MSRLPKPKKLDGVTPSRSALMGRIRGSNTKPEIAVRSMAHKLGFRFRLNRRSLPGSPDLVFPRLQKIVFVHGCFWHRHPGCSRTTNPKTRESFWRAKFERNVERDKQILEQLHSTGWDCLVIWECETFDRSSLRKKLKQFLSRPQKQKRPDLPIRPKRKTLLG
ncbi:very short patch repair endonuclease [Bradyrhizobium sp. YR681]|uniref:very short patch repair endonuclease n=1 Tax=Bradyrhizobium sp. YR681 TaxID=1144344 RepID=UPI0024BFEEBF|nr:very short patch repair endonuclease [Bradyrhizobium sp. YR681]